MDALALRPVAPAFRLGAERPSVETLQERVNRLVLDRQELRRAGASSVILERNRLDLARAQWELSHALIERHLPAPATAA